MKITSRHNWFLYRFFIMYTHIKIRFSFSGVEIRGSVDAADKPVLMLSNHSTWWDGFWAMYVNRKLFRRKFHFMMLAGQLEKHWFFKYTGGYPVERGTRSVLESINYTIKLLTDKRNLVLLFPQGEIESIHNHEVKFKKGVSRVVEKSLCSATVVFAVFLVDYFSRQKPALYCYLREYRQDGSESESAADAYSRFYNECIESNIAEKERWQIR